MTACAICAEPIDGPRLTDPDAGRHFHPACAVERLPLDTLDLLLGVLALVLVPTVMLWAA
jgi:hypothetical protein